MSQNGKGDRNRSDPVKYAKGYDRIFKKKNRCRECGGPLEYDRPLYHYCCSCGYEKRKLRHK